MASVPVQIVEYISDDQPGFVAAQLVDAYGVTHTFHDKVPVFGCDPLDRDSALPVSGWLGCEIIERFTYHGRELARIDTEKPTLLYRLAAATSLSWSLRRSLAIEAASKTTTVFDAELTDRQNGLVGCVIKGRVGATANDVGYATHT